MMLLQKVKYRKKAVFLYKSDESLFLTSCFQKQGDGLFLFLQKG